MTLRSVLRLCEDEVTQLRAKVIEVQQDRDTEVAALLDLIEDLTIQGCSVDDGGMVDSMALSAYAESLRLLAEKGRYQIVAEYGRRVIARRVEHG